MIVWLIDKNERYVFLAKQMKSKLAKREKEKNININ